MNYKIHTAPVIEAYRTDCECPMCLIERELDRKHVSNYLNAAVMAPERRTEVNRLGFCARHYDALLAGDNILGVALQTKTRTEAVRERLVRPVSAKAAKKEGERLRNELASCVVCAEIDAIMQRYYETVAALFRDEPAFEQLLRNGKGHCARHYAELLRTAGAAGKAAARYADVLYNRQYAAFCRLDADLQGFVDRFDSAKRNSPTPETALDAVPRAVDKIKGY